MPQIEPISKIAHADKYWRRSPNYYFAAKDMIAPVVVPEITRVCVEYPLAFVPDEDRFALVALLGLQNEQNLYIHPEGRWMAEYIPAVYRAYPFALANTTDDKQVLCFDKESGLLLEEDEENAQPFFDTEGQPAPFLNRILEFLGNVRTGRQAAQQFSNLLQENNLIVPWELTAGPNNSGRKIEGLHKVDEEALMAMSGEDFLKLREAGVIPLIYAQLLSMQNINALRNLARAHHRAETRQQGKQDGGELDLEFLNDDSSIKFH